MHVPLECRAEARAAHFTWKQSLTVDLENSAAQSSECASASAPAMRAPRARLSVAIDSRSCGVPRARYEWRDSSPSRSRHPHLSLSLSSASSTRSPPPRSCDSRADVARLYSRSQCTRLTFSSRKLLTRAAHATRPAVLFAYIANACYFWQSLRLFPGSRTEWSACAVH